MMINSETQNETFAINIVVVIHTIIITIGVIGNATVIIMFISNKKLRNVRNAFMVNLTLSHLILATVCAPWFLTTLKYPNMSVGDLWCRLSHSISIVIILVSAFSIMMISIDRWMFVVYARNRQLSTRDTIVIILLIWIISISLSGPMFYHRHAQKELIEDSIKQEFINALLHSDFGRLNSLLNANKTDTNSSMYSSMSYNIEYLNSVLQVEDNNKYLKDLNGSDKEYCVESWAQPYYKRIYVMILFGLEFFLPCVTMLVTYIWIIRFLKNQHDRMSTYEMQRKISIIKEHKPHQRNCFLLTSLCLAFIFCSLPLSLFNILLDIFINLNKIQQKEKAIYWLIIILTTLELLNIVISPLLYGWMNRNFRTEMDKNFKSIRSRFGKKTNDHELSIHMPLKNDLSQIR